MSLKKRVSNLEKRTGIIEDTVVVLMWCPKETARKRGYEPVPNKKGFYRVPMKSA